MIKIGDKVKLIKKEKIAHSFKIGEVYRVKEIREKERTLEVTDEGISQTIEIECFQPVNFEEIIYE